MYEVWSEHSKYIFEVNNNLVNLAVNKNCFYLPLKVCVIRIEMSSYSKKRPFKCFLLPLTIIFRFSFSFYTAYFFRCHPFVNWYFDDDNTLWKKKNTIMNVIKLKLFIFILYFENHHLYRFPSYLHRLSIFLILIRSLRD